MKFVIPSTELLTHLQLMGKVMNSKNTMPILDYILLQLKGTKLTIMASDLETTLISEVEVPSVQEEGSVAVPRMMLETLKEFPEQPLTIIVKDNHLIEISWATGKASIPGFDPQDFPAIPELKGKATKVKFAPQVLNDAISKSLFATANDELRPVMNGVYFDFTGDDASVIVASDAHKLVRYRRLDVKASAKGAFILPKKPATLLRSILVKEQNEVEVNFDDKNAAFNLSGYKLVCRFIEGNFPAYNSVIPPDNHNKASVDRLEMLTVVKRIATLAPAGTSLIRLRLSANQLTISAQDIDFSYSGTERMACQYDGEEMEIGLKSSFLSEILMNLSSHEVSLEFSDPSRPVIFLPVGEPSDQEDTLMLLMPMMISA